MNADDIKQDLLNDLPVLTDVVDDDLPLLTEVVEVCAAEVTAAEIDPVSADCPSSQSEELSFDIPPQLEAHLEALFMQRLLPRLEEAQRQAIARTWNELKDELPQLIRAALPPRS